MTSNVLQGLPDKTEGDRKQKEGRGNRPGSGNGNGTWCPRVDQCRKFMGGPRTALPNVSCKTGTNSTVVDVTLGNRKPR